MMSLQVARYALWHHPSQQMSGTLHWRVTPKSKQFKAIVPPTVLPGEVLVQWASDESISLGISREQADTIREWTRELPDDVIPPTACDLLVIKHNGPYTSMNGKMKAGDFPRSGEHVLVRVTASVNKIGTLYKAQIHVIDVLRDDIAAE